MLSILSNAVKNFDIVTTSLNALHNYFSLTKLDLHLAKFLDKLAKSFFPCTHLTLHLYLKNNISQDM